MNFCSDQTNHSETELSRRSFLRLGALAAACCVSPSAALANTVYSATPERSLAFYNTHTGETLDTVYYANGEYVPDALSKINYILRDQRNNEIKAMDVRLLDLLYTIATKLETAQPFHIISGYRSPASNALLRRISSGVAEHSQHMEGKAADIRLPGINLSLLRRVSMSLKDGGVGYYPTSDFVHVDVARVRYW